MSESNSEMIALELLGERIRQTEVGWTREHDLHHGPLHLVEMAMRRMPEAEWIAGEYALSMKMGPEGRQRLLEAGALIIAAIEVLDATSPSKE